MKSAPPNEFRATANVLLEEGINVGLASEDTDGMNGVFFIPFNMEMLRCIVSDGEGWEHVSVSLSTRTPKWQEMCFVKDIFWGKNEIVIQYHPSEAQYINCHPYCLHLWKQTDQSFPAPPTFMIGPKQDNVMRESPILFRPEMVRAVLD